ncbi:MAG TPA: hypothetical protein ENH10_10410, partial [Bacteroidetes bacterium]|nr:hypothetical protein [Bacteroidota bacterium]HEX05544.1 hypothetical protein [Bacteroidota bacterium]
MIIHKPALITAILLTTLFTGCFDDNSDNSNGIAGNSSENEPWVQINYPAQWGTVSGIEEVRVEAGPGGEVDQVTLFVDGLVLSDDSQPPYFFAWDINGLSGSHTILARAYTGADSVDSGLLTVSVSEIPDPAPVITSPSNLSTVDNTVTVIAEETQSADIDSLVLYIDGLRFDVNDSAPYQFVWTVPEGNGSHTLFVRSWEGDQSGTSPLVTV